MRGTKTLGANGKAWAILSVACLSCAGRETASAANDAFALPSTASIVANVAVNAEAELRDAAELFENLTETAFDASWATLDGAIGKATSAAEKTRSHLPPDANAVLDAQLAAIKSSREKQDRAAMAIASVEGFRVFVSALPTGSKVPVEVSLLDYVGFRYNADLKTKPVRWDDMKESMAFASKTAVTLAPKLSSQRLAARVKASLSEMENAVTGRNEKLAATAVKTELDLVDDLEKAF